MASTISEIAQLAGVSTATVSRAFSNKGYISETQRQRILEIAQEHNYLPKDYKRHSVDSRLENDIAIVAPDIYNSYFHDIIRGIQSVTDKMGCDIFICDTNGSVKKEIRYLDSLKKKRIGGIIISVASDNEKYNIEFLENLNRTDIPVVLIDRDVHSRILDGVFFDDYHGAYQATQAIIEAGHSEIAIICGATETRTGVDILNGYLAALKEASIPIKEEYILYGEYSENRAYELTKKLLTTQPNVTSCFCSNGVMAEGFLHAVKECKLRIPNDIAFISYGKREFYNYMEPPISYVDRPVYEAGIECAKILADKMRLKKRQRMQPKKNLLFGTTLCLNGSERYPTSKK